MSGTIVGAGHASVGAFADTSEITWRAAHGTLEMLRFMLGARVVALFACEPGPRIAAPRLIASEGLTQAGLDLARELWAAAHASLAEGEPCGRDHPPALLLPCKDGRGVTGLAYVEGRGAFNRSRLPLLVPLSPVLARVLRRLGNPAAPLDDDGAAGDDVPGIDALQLQVLLERHEWNVSRVARVMGVTRMTVYNRLRRACIARQRVSKSASRCRREGSPDPVGGE
jgi:hypothetical protein